MKRVIDDKSVAIAFTDEKDASNPVSESESKGSGYDKIKKTMGKVYPEAIAVPFLVTATTDSRHYKVITDNIYRFVPMVLTGNDIKKFTDSTNPSPLKIIT